MDRGKNATDHSICTYVPTAKLAPINENINVNIEVPPDEMVLFLKLTNRERITVWLSSYVTHPATCLAEAGQVLVGPRCIHTTTMEKVNLGTANA